MAKYFNTPEIVTIVGGLMDHVDERLLSTREQLSLLETRARDRQVVAHRTQTEVNGLQPKTQEGSPVHRLAAENSQWARAEEAEYEESLADTERITQVVTGQIREECALMDQDYQSVNNAVRRSRDAGARVGRVVAAIDAAVARSEALVDEIDAVSDRLRGLTRHLQQGNEERLQNVPPEQVE